jgi:hypothetical protein
VILAILESKESVTHQKGRKTFCFINLDQCAPVQTIVKKISSRKNQYKKEETISTNNPLETPCPKCVC